MAKKSRSNSKIIDLVVLLAGIGAICMIFLAAVKYTSGNSVKNFTGINIIFGYTETTKTNLFITTITTSLEIFKFSFMNLLTYIFIIIGAIGTLLNLLGKSKKLLTLISAICFGVGAAFMFMTVNFVIPATTTVLNNTINNIDISKLTLGIGAIIGGSLSAFAALLSLIKLVIKK